MAFPKRKVPLGDVFMEVQRKVWYDKATDFQFERAYLGLISI